jgi:predicted transcriptional regulator
MLPNDVAIQLHDRRTRGEVLSAAEQALLEEWYEQQDQEEIASFAKNLLKRYATMSNKELVIEALRKLPEDTSLEEISEEIAILAAIRRGEKAAEMGKVIPHEEVKARFASWKNLK